MDILILIWNIVGALSTLVVVTSVVTALYLCFRGFIPVLIRLGNGLWRRKVAIFASGDELGNLEGLLAGSRLFNSKNIIRISGRGELESAEKASVFLVHWPTSHEIMDEILQAKREQTALIVYAPPGFGRIPGEMMDKLDARKNVVLNNFRGRLLNDIVTSMITTGYEKN